MTSAFRNAKEKVLINEVNKYLIDNILRLNNSTLVWFDFRIENAVMFFVSMRYLNSE